MGQLGDFVGGSTARHAGRANLHDTQTWWCWQANAVELFVVAAFVRGAIANAQVAPAGCRNILIYLAMFVVIFGVARNSCTSWLQG